MIIAFLERIKSVEQAGCERLSRGKSSFKKIAVQIIRKISAFIHFAKYDILSSV